MIFIGFLVFDDFGGAIPEKWSDLIFLVIFHVQVKINQTNLLPIVFDGMIQKNPI